MAEWLCTGLQIRVDRFDSGLRLQDFKGLGIFYLGLFVLVSIKVMGKPYVQSDKLSR